MAKDVSPIAYEGWFKKKLTQKQRDIEELNLRRAEQLWSEYQYRHDLNWNLVFRLTTAIVILAIIPYTQDEVTRVLGYWVLLVPCLGLLLGGVGLAKLSGELRLLDNVRELYRTLQDNLCVRFHGDKKSTFTTWVKWYVRLLLLMALVNVVLLTIKWIPDRLGS